MKNQSDFLHEFFPSNFLPQTLDLAARLKMQERFRELGLSSFGDILEVYPNLNADEQFVAILMFMDRRFKASVPLLFREIAAANPRIGGAASAALASIGGDKVFLRLRRMFRRSSDRAVRLNAISALSLMRTLDVEDTLSLKDMLLDTLVHVLKDKAELEEARSMAAEGLAHALDDVDRRTKAYRRTTSLLTDMLDDASPEVRCSCLYALRELRVSG